MPSSAIATYVNMSRNISTLKNEAATLQQQQQHQHRGVGEERDTRQGQGQVRRPSPPPKVQDMNEMCVFVNEKAGMEQVDKEKVNKIVYEMSKDSSYFKNQERKRKKLEASLMKVHT